MKIMHASWNRGRSGAGLLIFYEAGVELGLKIGWLHTRGGGAKKTKFKIKLADHNFPLYGSK